MSAMPIRFLLCRECARAWCADAVETCLGCGNEPIDCSPWGSDRRAWTDARLDGVRRAAVFTTANYRGKDQHRASIRRGVEQRGNVAGGSWAP